MDKLINSSDRPATRRAVMHTRKKKPNGCEEKKVFGDYKQRIIQTAGLVDIIFRAGVLVYWLDKKV